MPPQYVALLNDFALHVGLLPEEFVKTGEVVVDGTTVTLFYEGDEDEGDVVFFSILAMPSPGSEKEIHRAALEANMLWAGTGGATLGVMPRTGALTLCGRIRVDEVNGQTLAVLIDHFVDTAKVWTGHVAEAAAAVAAPLPASGHPLMWRG